MASGRSVNVDAIPLELRQRPQWVVWRWGPAPEPGKKPKKPPYEPTKPGQLAKVNDPTTWGTFEHAAAAVEAGKADGIGLALTADMGIVGVDLDDELTEADQAAIALLLDSYTERSVSGAGTHVLVRARLNGRGGHPVGIGVFDTLRFFYCTGEHVRGMPTTIQPRQAELDEVLARFLPAKPAPQLLNALSSSPFVLNDQDLLARAALARNGADFAALYAGQWEGQFETQSQADQSLANRLAWWVGPDPGRIDSLIRASGLYRPKWDRPDYRDGTIEKGIASCNGSFYEPPSERTRGQKSDVSEAQKTASLAETERNGLTDSALKESVGPESVPHRDQPNPLTDSDPESVTDSGRPFALPIREFIALEREHREPLLANADGRAVVGRHSLTLLGALGGHGKTTLFVDIALHLVAGVDYPPFTVPRPVAVLLIENEGPEELFAEKLEGRLDGFPHELKARLDVCTFDWGGFSLADATARERLTREIADKQYDLVFGDPLDSLGIEGVGSPEDTRKFLALMKQTGLNKTVAWWLNTHPRKEETKEALNEISGAWGGKPDSVFLLRMLDDDRTQVRQPKLRWAKRGKGPTLLLAFDPDTEAFTYLGEESDAERDYLDEITTLLADGKWRITKEIAAPSGKGGIGANVDTIKQVLEEHPDVFEARTGEAAKLLGRKPQATVWQLREPNDETFPDAPA